MKVRCIATGGNRHITREKDYEVLSTAGGRYMLINDRDLAYEYAARLFEQVPEAPTLAHPSARKDDSGKLDMTLFDDMPRALEAVAEVMQWAITKKQPTPYVRGSWLGVSADRYRAAVMRHMSAAAKQNSEKPDEPYSAINSERDAETNLLHLAHTACSALMALENTLREMEAKK